MEGALLTDLLTAALLCVLMVWAKMSAARVSARIVQIGPSTRKGTRRSFLTASQNRSAESIFGTHACARSLCRPGGPDGKGQARGQARSARGEPSSMHVDRLLTVFCMTARRLIVPDTRPAQPVALHRTWSGQLR